MGTDYPYTEADYPCKKGDILYRISDNCGGCEFETEVCQQRTCKHAGQYRSKKTHPKKAQRQFFFHGVIASSVYASASSL